MINKIVIHINKLLKNNLFNNFKIILSGGIAVKFLGFITTILIIRFLSPADYGIYSFLLANIMLLVSLSDLEMKRTAMVFSGQQEERKDSIFGFYLGMRIIICLLITVLILLFGEYILSVIKKPELTRFIPVFLTGFWGWAFFMTNDSYLEFMQQFKKKTALNIFRSFLTLLAISIIIILNKNQINIITLVYLIPLLFLIIFIPNFLNIFRGFSWQDITRNFLVKIFNYQKKMTIWALINTFAPRVHILMIAAFLPMSKVGIFSAAFTLIKFMQIIPGAINTATFSQFTRYKGKELYNKTTRLIKLLSVFSVSTIPVIFIFPFIIRTLFGDNYSESIVISQILFFLIVLLIINIPVKNTLIIYNKQEILALFRFLSVILNIILNLITIPVYGVFAAAINAVLSVSLFNLLSFLYYFSLKHIIFSKDEIKNENIGTSI